MRANTLQIENIENTKNEHHLLKKYTKNGKMMKALRYTLGLSSNLRIKNETVGNETFQSIADGKRICLNSMTETKAIKSLLEKRSEILENQIEIRKERNEK